GCTVMAAEDSTPKKILNILSSFLHQEEYSTDLNSSGDGSFINEKSPMNLGATQSKEAYFQRVQTFSMITWVAKPADLSPLHCARYGWENVDNDILRCVTCKAVLSAKLPENYDPEIYEECCENIGQSIVHSHQQLCPWSVNPSPLHFAAIPLEDKTVAADQYLNRFKSLIQMGEKIPALQLNSLVKEGGANMKQKLLEATMSSLIEETTSSNEEIVGNCAVLALTGWCNNGTRDSQIITCKYCCRHIGLWSYISAGCNNAQSTTEDEDEDGPSNKRIRSDRNRCQELFDPINEHRLWCPWVAKPRQPTTSPSSLSDSGDQSSLQHSLIDHHLSMKGSTQCGWRTLGDILLPSCTSPSLSDAKTSPAHEGLRNIRKILNHLAGDEAMH
ncbi:unnamed protein product, partial [Owenia fusiformis]